MSAKRGEDPESSSSSDDEDYVPPEGDEDDDAEDELAVAEDEEEGLANETGSSKWLVFEIWRPFGLFVPLGWWSDVLFSESICQFLWPDKVESYFVHHKPTIFSQQFSFFCGH